MTESSSPESSLAEGQLWPVNRKIGSNTEDAHVDVRLKFLAWSEHLEVARPMLKDVYLSLWSVDVRLKFLPD